MLLDMSDKSVNLRVSCVIGCLCLFYGIWNSLRNSFIPTFVMVYRGLVSLSVVLPVSVVLSPSLLLSIFVVSV